MAASLVAGGSLAANAAAAPQIAASSCGGIPVPSSGNAFCSFEGTGEAVVIAHNSCNVEGACVLIGNGVRIGHDSCNGVLACSDTGTLNGVAASAVSIIGNQSCNGEEACESAGSQGVSLIGDESCNGGAAACLGAGESTGTSHIGNSACNNQNIGAKHNTCLFVGAGSFGNSNIGNGSCNGSSACTFGGEFGGNSSIGNNACNGLGACFDVAQDDIFGDPNFSGSTSVVGNESCNAESACQFIAGFGGSSLIGNASCNNVYACEFAGSIDLTSAIGNHSCNGAPDLTNPDLPVGACDTNNGVIGNNQRNSP
jgi:hypothetical protein